MRIGFFTKTLVIDIMSVVKEKYDFEDLHEPIMSAHFGLFGLTGLLSKKSLCSKSNQLSQIQVFRLRRCWKDETLVCRHR